MLYDMIADFFTLVPLICGQVNGRPLIGCTPEYAGLLTKALSPIFAAVQKDSRDAIYRGEASWQSVVTDGGLHVGVALNAQPPQAGGQLGPGSDEKRV
jgi:hypothetical protein